MGVRAATWDDTESLSLALKGMGSSTNTRIKLEINTKLSNFMRKKTAVLLINSDPMD
jgi:hypothetical protein